MKTFCEKLILSINPTLKESDLEMLDKLSKEFDVLSVKNYIIGWDICTILSWLIINKLPYQIASNLVYNRVLYNPIVHVSDNGKIVISECCPKSNELDAIINKMNLLLGYAD